MLGRQRGGAFLSYARKDGEHFAARLRDRLKQQAPDIPIKQDRVNPAVRNAASRCCCETRFGSIARGARFRTWTSMSRPNEVNAPRLDGKLLDIALDKFDQARITFTQGCHLKRWQNLVNFRIPTRIPESRAHP